MTSPHKKHRRCRWPNSADSRESTTKRYIIGETHVSDRWSDIDLSDIVASQLGNNDYESADDNQLLNLEDKFGRVVTIIVTIVKTILNPECIMIS